MSDTPKQKDWSKPAAMAIPEGGYFKDKVEQGLRDHRKEQQGNSCAGASAHRPGSSAPVHSSR
jgi:hypothetical protein